ncbi:BAH domain-containing protein [Fusarium sp. LHS14.1]|nr:BAH domain-containing protein [Fusarium sp. LHS14.1]
MAKFTEEEHHFKVVQYNEPPPSREASGSVGGEVTKRQSFPFSSGKESHRYRVVPAAQWSRLQSYRCFLLQDTRFKLGDFVRVANRLTSQDNPTEHAVRDLERPERDWVAYILEIRAADPYHVFARVYWMYWPEDIPKRVMQRSTRIRGPEIFHQSHELIASNHMDIIDVMSVNGLETVKPVSNSRRTTRRSQLFWKESFDCFQKTMSGDMGSKQ